MRMFTFVVFGPALVGLCVLALVDRAIGTQRLWRATLGGALAGLTAAVAYDLFRLPFVYAQAWGIQRVVPPLNLFKVFPGFGAMILNQPLEQAQYTLTAELVGWTYHFLNGITFGIMYVALIGNAFNRHWAWAVVFAVGLELGMLSTRYPAYFHIPMTTEFVVVTLVAHLVFGIVLGRTTLTLWKAPVSNP